MASISAGEETRIYLTMKSAVAADMRRQQLQILMQKFWQLVLAVLDSQECSLHLLQNATATQIWPYYLGADHRSYGPARCLYLNSVLLHHGFGSKISKLKHKHKTSEVTAVYKLHKHIIVLRI